MQSTPITLPPCPRRSIKTVPASPPNPPASVKFFPTCSMNFSTCYNMFSTFASILSVLWFLSVSTVSFISSFIDSRCVSIPLYLWCQLLFNSCYFPLCYSSSLSVPVTGATFSFAPFVAALFCSTIPLLISPLPHTISAPTPCHPAPSSVSCCSARAPCALSLFNSVLSSLSYSASLAPNSSVLSAGSCSMETWIHNPY